MTAGIILSAVYSVIAIFAVRPGTGGLMSFPAVYRVIYIPAFFWVITFSYAYIFARLENRKLNIPAALMLGIPLNLYLAFSNMLFEVAIKAPEISAVYKIYIIFAFFVFTFGMAMWGVREIKSSNLFFAPAFIALIYPLFLGLKQGSFQLLGVISCVAICGIFAGNKAAYDAIVRRCRAIGVFFASDSRRIVLIFAVALCLRIAFGVNVISKTGEAFPTASDDGRTYDMMGQRLSRNAAYFKDPEFTPSGFEPGYSLFLGLVYRMFGRSFYTATLIQSAVGALVPVLVYLLACTMIDRRVGIVAAIWSALDQGLIMMSCVLGQESLYIPILTYVTYSATAYLASSESVFNSVRSMTTGIALGAASVVRSVIVYFIPVLVGCLLLADSGKRISGRMRDAAIVAVFACAMIAPFTVLNHMNSGKFYIITQPKPITQWESDEGYGYYFPGNAALARMGVNPFKDMRGSVVAIAREPVKFVSILGDLLPRRTVAFFLAYNFGFFDPVYMVNAAKLANRFASNLEFYIALAVAGGFILILRRSDWRRKALPAVLLIAYYAFVHIVICRMGNIRYRAPIHPYLLIFGALGLVSLYDYVREGLLERSHG